MSDTFSDVDKSAHVLEAIAGQERIDAWPDDAFGLPGWPRYWSAHFDATEVAEWERCVAESREAGFRFTCSHVVTAAVRR